MRDSTITPILAVIMSVYKNDKIEFVTEAVNSILNQEFCDFDLYIFYDGPIACDIDNHLSLISDNRVILLKCFENKGLACSLNNLLRVVLPKGYIYIARMDADDISEPKRFQKQVKYLNQNVSVDCLGTCAIEIDSEGNEYFRKQMPTSHQECLEFFRKRDCLIHPTVMFRRSYFDKAGLYPEDTYFGEDTMMWAQGFKHGCIFANIPEYLFQFRLDSNFFQRRRGWKHAKSIFKLRRRVNTMLGFGFKGDFYASLYALAKMMPTKLLDLIYKSFR